MRALLAPALLAIASGCASLPGPTHANDPWERYNRGMYEFNDRVDRAVLQPVARVYADGLPEFVQEGVANFFENLLDLGTGLNNLLQGKIPEGASDLARLGVNSVFGIAGLWDVATPLGLEKHREDFGQTLGRWGVGSGPYLVLPLLGPSTIRDTAGLPLDWYGDGLQLIDRSAPYWSAYGLRAVHLRAGLLPLEKVVEGAALDRYSFIRDGYLQRRRSLVYDGSPPDDDK